MALDPEKLKTIANQGKKPPMQQPGGKKPFGGGGGGKQPPKFGKPKHDDGDEHGGGKKLPDQVHEWIEDVKADEAECGHLLEALAKALEGDDEEEETQAFKDLVDHLAHDHGGDKDDDGDHGDHNPY